MSTVGRMKARVMIATIDMNLSNDSYVVLMSTKNFTERYYRDKTGWVKVSARGRRFRMTAEQVLNHLLPALAGIKPNLAIKVEHHDPPLQKEQRTSPSGCRQRRGSGHDPCRTSSARRA